MTPRSITIEVAEVVRRDAAGAESIGLEVRWSATIEGRSYGETLPVPPLTAHAYIMCRALYRAEEVLGELGADVEQLEIEVLPPRAPAPATEPPRQMGLAL